ncbi:hypothetical protein QYR58_02575 [Streptococcus iniae]|nr:hypothetical protein QYR58_02575 [Streptococcus iniae]
MKKNLKTLIFSSLSAVMLFSAAAVSANEPEYTGRPVHTFETITTYDTSQYLQELNGLYDYLKIEPEKRYEWLREANETIENSSQAIETLQVKQKQGYNKDKVDFDTKRHYFSLLYKKALKDLKYDDSDINAYVEHRTGLSKNYTDVSKEEQDRQFKKATEDLKIITYRSNDSYQLRVYIDDSYESQDKNIEDVATIVKSWDTPMRYYDLFNFDF